ncbi:hypothetical protein HK405_014959, partial [Cladochytrium tenue]
MTTYIVVGGGASGKHDVSLVGSSLLSLTHSRMPTSHMADCVAAVSVFAAATPAAAVPVMDAAYGDPTTVFITTNDQVPSYETMIEVVTVDVSTSSSSRGLNSTSALASSADGDSGNGST